MNKKEIILLKEEKIEERAAIVRGKARISKEDEKRYNALGKEILALRRKLY